MKRECIRSSPTYFSSSLPGASCLSRLVQLSCERPLVAQSAARGLSSHSLSLSLPLPKGSSLSPFLSCTAATTTTEEKEREFPGRMSLGGTKRILLLLLLLQSGIAATGSECFFFSSSPNRQKQQRQKKRGVERSLRAPNSSFDKEPERRA